MLSDIEISRQSPRLPIAEVAAQLGIAAAHLHPHGHYKGKLDLALLHHAPAREPGKLVLGVNNPASRKKKLLCRFKVRSAAA